MRILRYSDLEARLGINRITIWRRAKSDPCFPKPIRLGGSKTAAVGFLESEVDEWVAQQAAARLSIESR